MPQFACLPELLHRKRSEMAKIKLNLEVETFAEWLSAQDRRGDSIGDLARDVGSDPDWPDAKNNDVRDHLAYLRSTPGCDTLLVHAWKEYIDFI